MTLAFRLTVIYATLLTFIAEKNTDHVMNPLYIYNYTSKSNNGAADVTFINSHFDSEGSETLVGSNINTLKSHPLLNLVTPPLTSYWAQSGARFGTGIHTLRKKAFPGAGVCVCMGEGGRGGRRGNPGCSPSLTT